VNCSVVGEETSKYTTLLVPPPGVGFVTETAALEATAMLEAGTVAVSSSTLTKVVASAWPFQLIVAPFTNPAPCTVKVKPAPPGEVLDGASG